MTSMTQLFHKRVLCYRKFDLNAVNYSQTKWKFHFFIFVAFILVLLGCGLLAGGFIGGFLFAFYFFLVYKVAKFVVPVTIVLLWITSVIKVCFKNRKSSYSENSRFKGLKKQFWLTFEFQVIMTTVFLIHQIFFMKFYREDQPNDPWYSMIIFDVIKCYSAALMFALAIEFKVMIQTEKRRCESIRVIRQDHDVSLMETSNL
jgi:hypothetical protein